MKALLESSRNLRHRTLLATTYEYHIWVRQTLLPAKLLELLRSYWRTKRPLDW